MNKNYYAVILAGGVGSRFWPVSTEEYPKQFHDMLGTGKSLLRHTFDRLNTSIPKENILISTNERYGTLVLETLPEISKNQLILEPVMRNTAPAILYAAMKIKQQNPDAVMIIAPSDHWIDREDVFQDKLTLAFKYASSNDVLMTLGIMPSNPNTGYGYIQYLKDSDQIKKVIRFTEKPHLEKAKEFIVQGDYLWNAGIFIWSARSIEKAFQVFQPLMYELFKNGEKAYNTDFEDDFIRDNYSNSQSISIDYAILEQADNVKVIPVDMGWNDLGTWGSLYEKLIKVNQQNAIVKGQVSTEDSSGNLIRTSSNKKVFIKGLHNYIIVEEGDFLLILPKDSEQDIKTISKKMTL